ncbi:hypothetical protein [Patiriisocius sp. Uisw_017]|jgi:hypothetical protein|uniref:hypothetical protein n=1 Tax=Patiriisocius sp. Uisw_017 TaxID=3230968 RepID=UPI0039EB5B74
MSERIKLIWDFRGPNATPIATHHVKHLEEFSITEGLENTLCATENITEMHTIAYMVVGKEHMDDLRERLKPNRGQMYNEI